MNRIYNNLLRNKWSEKKFVCVGLDPVLEKIPDHLKKQYITDYDILFEFLKTIIDATSDIVCAYKPNVAFFEQYGLEGEKALVSLIQYIHRTYPDIPIIGDFKRGDIGNTNAAYAKSAFEVFGVDAITLSPYLGSDTLEAFSKYEGKGLILLCRTSNPRSSELQELPININAANESGLLTDSETQQLLSVIANTKGVKQSSQEIIPTKIASATPRNDNVVKLYELVAFLAQNRWNTNNNLSLVVGATHPESFANIRKLAPDLPFLIPGIGTQGGNLEKTLESALDANKQGIIINSSSGILYASNGEDFAQEAKETTLKLTEEIQTILASSPIKSESSQT